MFSWIEKLFYGICDHKWMTLSIETEDHIHKKEFKTITKYKCTICGKEKSDTNIQIYGD